MPDTYNLSKIASLFEIPVNDLIDEDTNPISTSPKPNKARWFLFE